MSLMRKFRILGIILAMFLVLSCAGLQSQPMTEQDYYDEATGWWLDTEQNFKTVYLVSTDLEQKEMLPFLKILHESKQVLDMWGLKVQGGDPTLDQVQQWKNYKNDMVLLILNNYKEKTDGG